MGGIWPIRGATSPAVRVSLISILTIASSAQQRPEQAGPYLANIVEGGPAVIKSLPAGLAGARSRTEELWLRTDSPDSDTLIAGIGDPTKSSFCYFELRHG